MYSIAYVFIISLSLLQGVRGSDCARNGVNFWGADISNFIVSNFGECERKCENLKTCKAITYRTSDKMCWLKSKRGGEAGPSLINGLISANMDCNNKSDQSCAKHNIGYGGADMGQRPANSLSQCEQFCRDSEHCASFTYQTSGACWLKYRKSGEKGPSNGENMVSLNMDCPTDTIQDCVHKDTDFGGSDLISLRSGTFGNCKGFCREEPSCLSFTFRVSDGQCWLKYRRFGMSSHSHMTGINSMNMYCD
ncbi:hypothetical protein ACHWQZ_G017998 [Mnemiopsis leidyi]